jgi:cytochrome P450
MAMMVGAENVERVWSLLSKAMMDAEGLQDPYPLLREMHAYGDHVRTPDGVYAVFGYDRVNELTRSAHFRKETKAVFSSAFAAATKQQLEQLREAAEREAPFLVLLNPPDHTRIRGIVSRGFLQTQLVALRPAIKFHIDRLLGAIDPTRPVDIIGSFSSLFAPEIVGHLIGLPADQRAIVSRQTARQMRGFDPSASFDEQIDGARARVEQADYIRAIIADRRKQPREDFVTGLIAQSDAQGLISDAELVALIQILYIGGYETTSHMIGNGIVALLTHPDQLAALRAAPELMRAAVDEMLRFDGPISLTQVVAAEGAELGGRPAEVGATYIGLLGAANHDPAAFDHPERFDIGRPRKASASFAGGAHFCLGAGLAKLELELVFGELIRRFPDMRLADTKLTRIPAFHQRAYQAVSVLLQPER